MNKINISNMLHQAFTKTKNAYLIIFALVIACATLQSSLAFGQGLVPSVETKIRVEFDGKSKTFIATQNTVEGALRQGGISLNKFDATVPPKESVLNGRDTKVLVKRQLPVLIADGNQQFVAYSAYSDPKDILKQIDLGTYPEDRVNVELILDPVYDNAVGQKIVIERAPTFTVSVDGEEKIIRSWGKTIKDVLDQKVALGQRDIVVPSLGSNSQGEGNISITRVNVAEIEEMVTIPSQTTYKDEYSLYQGQTKVLQAGSNGEKKQQVKITYHNGAEIDRTVLGSEVVSSPVTEIIARGVKPYNAGVWWDKIIKAAKSVGVDGLRMYKVMDCESHGNPYAGTTYKGLFQYGYGTWLTARSKYGGSQYSAASITNGDAQVYVTARKIANEGWGAWPTCAYR